ncbi:MAG: hypothetical protein A2070_07405 [Bdellovibrionales bacterium GWC1_52_8]|nr:MAG: hypothetical protein A2070_07405 [Bdellovibrionales bacterium GWC1_52_8]
MQVILVLAVLAMFGVKLTRNYRNTQMQAPTSSASAQPAAQLESEEPLETPFEGPMTSEVHANPSPHLAENESLPIASPSPEQIPVVLASATPQITPQHPVDPSVKNRELVAKFKTFCDQKFMIACMRVATGLKLLGQEAEAYKYLEIACKEGVYELDACGELAASATSNQISLGDAACTQGQTESCNVVAAYYNKAKDPAAALVRARRGCSLEDSSSCFIIGYVSTPEEITKEKASCLSGNSTSCLVYAGAMESSEQDKEEAAFMSRSCDLGDFSACVNTGREKTDADAAVLKSSCDKGGLAACGSLVGYYAKREQMSLAADPLKRICDSGKKAACKMAIYAKDEPAALKELLRSVDW